MSDEQLPTVPAELQSRLEAAGVRADDPESLQRALNADPELARDLRALLAANPTLQLNALLNTFLAVPDFNTLLDFWQHIPADSEDAFIGVVEQTIAQAEQAGNTELAQALGQRLEGLRQIQAQQQVMAEQLGQWASKIAAASDGQQVGQIWNDIPSELEHAVLSLVEQQIASWEQAGEQAAASRAQGWLAALRQIQQQRDELARQPPEVRAVLAFLQADDDAARSVFQAQKELLQPYSAQELMNTLAAQAPAELQERFSARATLLRALRGAAPTPQEASATSTQAPVAHNTSAIPSQTSFHNEQVQIEGNLNQAGERVYDRSANAEGPGAMAVLVNNIYEAPADRCWFHPEPPAISAFIPRAAKVADISAQLQQQHDLIITSGSVALQGMAGIGKTVLSRLVAHALRSVYPAGILDHALGRTADASDVERILRRWVAHCYNNQYPRHYSFTPASVRDLLAEVIRQHGRLLIVVDDVWDADLLEPLLEARPQEAHILITTRSHWIGERLNMPIYQLDVLDADEAMALLQARLGSRFRSLRDTSWTTELFTSVGYHTLALDIVLYLLKRVGADRWAKQARTLTSQLQHGQGFEQLRLDSPDRQRWVELSLRLSYDDLTPPEQSCFRQLGVMAADSDSIFAAENIAEIWQLPLEQTYVMLERLTGAALLTRIEQPDLPSYWHQHALLRGYALALLQREGEYEAAAARHADVYAQAMQAADDRQRYAAMLPFYPQLRHAFTWAIANDLERAQNLIANTANLQAAFSLAYDTLAWAEQALTIAQARRAPGDQARGYGTLGNALQRIATLGGEDRATRLRQALAAYDLALRFYTPETAPLDFATTQNNRGNVLQALATLAEEDRATRLRQALAAYDLALRFRTPETAPLAFATTQNNRGNVLQALATLAEEDRATRLRQALAAYDLALRFRTPETAPLAFATTQNNRGTVLQELATLAEEDRAARLRQALAAYDLALRFRTPETAPLDFAMTQGNLLNLFQQLAELPGEDQRQHRIAALQAGWRAFSIFRALGHGPYQQQIVRLLQALQRAYGAEFAQLWQQAIAEPMPAWLQEEPQDAMQSLLNRFLAISTGAELAAFWQQMPAEAEPGFFQLVEQWIAAAAEQHNAELAEALRQRLAGIQQLQAAQSPLMQQFQQALSQYLALRQQAAQDANNPAAWQAAVHAGEALLGQEFAELEQVNWTELRAELANDYTSLCIAHEEQHALEASLAATERAIELAPENAMWRRNRTGTLIDLGRLDEAAAELERARALEPEAARLAELEQQLHPEG